MRESHYFLAIAIVCVSLNRAYSQGELLPKDSSGLGISCGFAASKLSTSYGLAAGYSLFGRLDVGASIGKVNIIRTNEGFTIPTTRGTYIAPSLTYYIVRQDEGVDDVSIGLTVAFEHVTYSPADVLGKHADFYSGGIFFFQEVLKSRVFKLEPIVHVVASHGESTDVTALAGVFFGLRDVVGQVIGLTVSGAYQSSYIVGGLELSFVF